MGPWLIFASLMNNACIALYDGLPTGAEFVQFVNDIDVTILGMVPSLVRRWRTLDTPVDFRGIRLFSSTGEPSNSEDYLWLMHRAGFNAPIIEYCGGTEIGGGHITGALVLPASPSTFTSPALGLDFRILNEDNQEVTFGEAGELYIVPPSIGLSQRLLNKNHDEVYFDGCPTGPDGEQLRRHGDMICRLPKGFYRAVGRADDTMNLSGIKVSSVDLEQVIISLEVVKDCAAIAVQLGDEGPDHLVIYAVLDHEVDLKVLKQDCQTAIATQLNPLFKIHDLIPIDTLPRTASNKLMRRTLRASYSCNKPPKSNGFSSQEIS